MQGLDDFEKTVQTQKDKQKYVDEEIAAETELLKQKNARIRERYARRLMLTRRLEVRGRSPTRLLLPNRGG